jgi:hypothetical protein
MPKPKRTRRNVASTPATPADQSKAETAALQRSYERKLKKATAEAREEGLEQGRLEVLGSLKKKKTNPVITTATTTTEQQEAVPLEQQQQPGAGLDPLLDYDDDDARSEDRSEQGAPSQSNSEDSSLGSPVHPTHQGSPLGPRTVEHSRVIVLPVRVLTKICIVCLLIGNLLSPIFFCF